MVDAAVHDLHVLILNQAFAGARKSEEWLNVFCSFPRLDGEKTFLREVTALRAIVPADAGITLDSEVAKVKAAYSLAGKILAGSRSTKRGKQKVTTSQIEQPRIS